jgi:hypothetical protein
MLRVGKSAQYDKFEGESLLDLLRGTETDLLHQIGRLTRDLHRVTTHEERAVIRQQIQSLRRQM